MKETFIEDLFSLRGKVAVVTGASRGIGLEIARAYSACGAVTVGMGRSPTSADFNKDLIYLTCDIRNKDDLKKSFDYVCQRFGRIDILLNAAGITLNTQTNFGRFEVFHETLSTNLLAAYHACEYAATAMALNEGGSIINVTSIASLQGFPGNPGYVASKGALRLMTKALAVDYASLGIRVNSIVPGYIHTEMTEKSFSNPEEHKKRLDRMIIKRWGNAVDLVGAAIYLASNASSYVTGIDLVVDGGWSAKGM